MHFPTLKKKIDPPFISYRITILNILFNIVTCLKTKTGAKLLDTMISNLFFFSNYTFKIFKIINIISTRMYIGYNQNKIELYIKEIKGIDQFSHPNTFFKQKTSYSPLKKIIYCSTVSIPTVFIF